jgi:PREDICTED: similar to polyglutamine binding protein 1
VPKLKTMIKEEENLADLESEKSESESESRDSDSDLSSNHSDLEKEYRKVKGKFSNFSASSRLDHREKRRNRKNDLDPMDPAAYSDTCPRGKWSDGLERKEDKNGAE